MSHEDALAIIAVLLLLEVLILVAIILASVRPK